MPGLRLLSCAFFCVFGFMATALAADPRTTGVLQVTARVMPFASMQVNAPTSFTVSAADVSRGFVELQVPVQINVHSNVPEGYTLAFDRSGDNVRQAVVQMPGAEVRVGDGTARAARPAPSTGRWRDHLLLRVRFDLAADVQRGEHPWPLRISMASQ
jgi:hypothetical protein